MDEHHGEQPEHAQPAPAGPNHYADLLAAAEAEQMRERARQLSSEVHTLLVSFPPGDARRALNDRFPELNDEPVSGVSPLYIEAASPADAVRILTDMQARAVDAVGGDERAELLLHYPGVLQNEQLNEVRRVRDDWHEVAMDANTYLPQTFLGITTKLGRTVMTDVRDGAASWADLIHAYLDAHQLAAEKEQVYKLHKAFRAEPAMPAGYAHERTAFVIPDTSFQGIWRSEVKGVVEVGRVLSNWVEAAEGVSLPAAGMLPNNSQDTTIDPSTVQRLDAVFADPRFTPYVDSFIALFEAAEAALDSEHGLALQNAHRQEFNTRRRGEHSPEAGPYQALKAYMGEAVREQAAKLVAERPEMAVPSNLAAVFTKLLDGRPGKADPELALS